VIARSSVPISEISMTKWVYAFGAELAEGKGEMKNLLGGKGANLAEMAIARPAGSARLHHHHRSLHLLLRHEKTYPAELAAEVDAALASVGRRPARLRRRRNPLLVSVRSGARASMPGMMDTVLNLGLNDESVRRWPRPRATSASPMTAIAASSRCIRTWCWGRPATISRRSSRITRIAAADARHRPFRRRLARRHRGLQGQGRGG
jgi:hypothetical protein